MNRQQFSIYGKILWSNGNNKKGIAMVKWEVIQRPKSQGGLRVGDAIINNASLLFEWKRVSHQL